MAFTRQELPDFPHDIEAYAVFTAEPLKHKDETGRAREIEVYLVSIHMSCNGAIRIIRDDVLQLMGKEWVQRLEDLEHDRLANGGWDDVVASQSEGGLRE